MAATSQTPPSLSFHDDQNDSGLMNGGPVGPINGQYVNGTSTNGSNSPPPTPRLPTKGPEEAQDIPHPHMSPRPGTWPRSPSPSPSPPDPPLPAELGPEEQACAAASARHASHPIPSLGPHEGEAGGPRSRTYARVRTYTDDVGDAENMFPRISRPVELLRSSYDCVVIGSGYGGAVAASRMARTGETVCVLERGKEKWPGEYPSGPEGALDELHWSGTFSPGCYMEGMPVDGGDPTGMYHLIFGKGQNAVVCNGESAVFISNLPLCVRVCTATDVTMHRSWWDKLDECQRLLGG